MELKHTTWLELAEWIATLTYEQQRMAVLVSVSIEDEVGIMTEQRYLNADKLKVIHYPTIGV